MPSDRPETVDLYVHWLYTRSIHTRPSIEEIGKHCTESALLVDLFVFAERMQNGYLKDATVDALILAMNTADKGDKMWYPICAVKDAYAGTPAGSPLRRLFVDMYVSHGSSRWI